jgi:hypothetical protein
MRHVVGDMNRAGQMTHQVDARGVATTLADLARDPGHDGGKIFGARRVGRLRREPIGGVDADEAVVDGPQHHIVVERAGRSRPLVAADEGAAVDEDQHRSG